VSDDVSVLIVDANGPFATIFKEGLEQSGGYRVTTAASGDEALRALAADRFDLAVVDLGLADPDGATVARSLRRERADLRLMVIPLVGEILPSELADLDVQGVLPKPFFLPELPGRVAAALAKPVRARARSPQGAPVAEEALRSRPAFAETLPSGADNPAVRKEMVAMARDIHAEAVILTHGARLVASVGRLSDDEVDGLTQAVAESWRTSTRVAQILGREQLRFEQSVEGGEYLFYSVAVAEDVILSAALRADVPLGMIRHRAKQAVDALRPLIGEEIHGL